MPSAELSVERSAEPIESAADSTWLLWARSVATTVRTTLPGATDTLRAQSGSWQPSLLRSGALTASGSPSYCSMVIADLRVTVTSVALTACAVAPGGRGGGGTGGGGEGFGCEGLGDGGDGGGSGGGGCWGGLEGGAGADGG